MRGDAARAADQPNGRHQDHPADLARRWQQLQGELDQLDVQLQALVTSVAPTLVALPGVGVETAGQLLVTAGDNPQRLGSEAAFAHLCGAAPIPASSGRTHRHRLNRGGDRRANHALWRIALVRMWDHVLVLLGTGLRFGEFAGLRRRRVHLERTLPVLQVVDVRYQAGRFGSGFKPRPKSDAGIREIPLAPLAVEVIRSQLPPGADPDALVFAGPGGGNHVAAGTRTVLSRHGIRRMYQTAVKRADLDHLQLRGPHDFRHTFSTWLEDAGIPARVIDELMGHQRSRHGDLDGGSRIGARYRHTTDEMAARVVDAIETRLQMVLRMAEEATGAGPSRRSFRVF